MMKRRSAGTLQKVSNPSVLNVLKGKKSENNEVFVPKLPENFKKDKKSEENPK